MATETQIDGAKNAHTPGPWSVITDDHDISVSGEGWFEDQNVNGWVVVGNVDNPNMAIAVLDTGFQNQWNDAENDANARLIAAAPDLLSELTALVTAVTYADPPVFFNDVLCHEARVPVEFIQAARAALAKVTAA